jgi:hypothetical protein
MRRTETGVGRLSENCNFYQKNNSPFGRVILFLPMRGKNRVTDTDNIIAILLIENNITIQTRCPSCT